MNTPALVLTLWNGTNNRVHSFPQTQGEATDKMANNWRLYLQWTPAGKYNVGDTLENADLLNPAFQL